MNEKGDYKNDQDFYLQENLKTTKGPQAASELLKEDQGTHRQEIKLWIVASVILVAEKTTSSRNYEFAKLTRILEIETSLAIYVVKSNKWNNLPDDRDDSCRDDKMDSGSPRAKQRKEVRRPRTRHKPAEFRLLHQLFKPIRPRIQEEDQMKRFILYYIEIIFS